MVQASSFERQMLMLINDERTSRGLNPVQLDLRLNNSAETHSQWMLAEDVFSHTGALGSSAGTRMQQAGFQFSGNWTWAENIAWQSERGAPGLTDDVQNLHNSLMNSSGHRANILNPSVTVVGIGIEQGDFNGWNAVIVTQNFAATSAPLQLDTSLKDNEGLENGTAPTSGADELSLSSPGILRGLGGNDTLTGTSGKDKLYGDAGKDNLKGGGGSDELNGGGGRDKLNGGGGGDKLNGGSGKDKLKGGNGNDELNGGAGLDMLNGGGGDDVFIFDSNLRSKTADIIEDFDPTADLIHLDNGVFLGLDAGALDASAFRANDSGNAEDVSDRIIYEEDTGNLYFDQDGSADGFSKVKFATIDPGLTIAEDDLFII